MKLRWLLLLIFFVCPKCIVQAQNTAGVTSFSPEGLVKNIRQVRVQFSEAMTPMGDPRDLIKPFAVDCPVNGSSKWEDSTNWVYDFDKDLPGGVKATFRLRPGLKSLSGKTLTGKNVFTFYTGGPSIKRSRPWNGYRSIDEEQIFLLLLDCPANEADLLKFAYFRISGIGEKVGFQVIKGQARANLLRKFRSYQDSPDNPVVLIRANRRFPNEAKVELVWSKDIPSQSGLHNDDDQTLSFEVRPVFRANTECERVNSSAPCIPITPIRLNFSAPVSWNQVRRAVLEEPGGKKHVPVRSSDSEGEENVQSVTFNGAFPEKATLRMVLPPNLKDDAGRLLTNQSQFPLMIPTGEYPPLVKFAADFGILELNGDPILPVTVRNVEPKIAGSLVEVKEGSKTIAPEAVIDRDRNGKVLNLEHSNAADAMQGKILRIAPDRANQIRLWFDKLSEHHGRTNKRNESVFGHEQEEFVQRITVPKLSGAKSFEVMGIPLKKPGFYVVEIRSEILGAALLGKTEPMYVSTAVLVTNLSVHFKWGVESSLVWVTTLDKARLVSGAHVEIRNCDGKVLWQGETDQNGIARPVGLPLKEEMSDCPYSDLGNGLMATARSGDDFAFVFSSWDEGIEPWRFNLPIRYEPNWQSTAHTVLDRPLFRAGETVHMKHFLRRQRMEGFGLISSSERPTKLKISHLGSDKTFEIPLKWLPDGTAETNWTIPREANLGNYQLSMELQKGNERTEALYSGSFRVEEFRLPIMRASILPPAEDLVAPKRIHCGLQVSYLSGGGASDLKIKFRHQVQDSFVKAPEAFDGYTFVNGLVKEGITRSSEQQDNEDMGEEGRPMATMKSQNLSLDKTGNAQVEILRLPDIDAPKEVLAEFEYSDPNGEIQTVSRRIPLYPSRRLIGIQPDSWVASREKLRFRIAVTDLNGKPVIGAPVQVELFTQKYYSHRSRIIGGFYEYDTVNEIAKAGSLCSGITNERGLLICEGASPAEGNVIIQARTKDPEGRMSAVHQDVWVAGKEQWWFNVSKDDRIDVLPEKKRYEPGETARFQVRMPFKEATALVSVEREGVSDVFIQKISSQSPIVEVPLKPNYSPNVFVSVLVVRGRNGEIQPTATVDLGRPAYKLGIAEINVGWKSHELRVDVTTPRNVYQVREKVPVEVFVRQADSGQPASGGEVAIAAIDEALLELLPNESWNLLNAMMGRRIYSVRNATSHMHVIGKRHFGLKSVPAGGGGGRELSRELFDTLLLWRARLPLDSQGVARVEIPLNDSLTSFRIVAIANSGSGRFGTGSSTVRSTQNLMVLSGIPPAVRETDKFPAIFTVRNNTKGPMSLEAKLSVAGLAEAFPSQKIQLNANEAKTVSWQIQVPSQQDELTYKVQVQSATGQQDTLQIKQKVTPHTPVKPLQSTILQLDQKQSTEVAKPADSLPGQGGIQIHLRSKIADGLPGVVDYMKKYPYSCLEQETSRSVALREKSRWSLIMDRLPAYLDRNGLAKYFPSCSTGSVALTAYLLSVGHEAGWAIPDTSRAQLISGLKAFLDGKVLDPAVYGGKDLDSNKLLAMEALSRYEISVKNWIRTLSIAPNLWPTSSLIDWREILRRQTDLPNHSKLAAELEKILGTRLDFRGTTMGFSTEKDDFRWWLMASGDVNANRLILSVLNSPSWRTDMPRLVKGSLSRQNFGRWLTTVANAWGVLALEKFSQLFENEPVNGISMGQLGTHKQSWDWGKMPKGDTRLFKWPETMAPVELQHHGTGKPWAVVTALAAVPVKTPFSNGFKIRKTLTPIVQKTKGVWNRGDIVRIRLECEAQADMGWVVVNDPVPGGATILGTGLGRDSKLATQGEKKEGWAWPAFEERSQEAFRAYYEYVQKGTWILEYTIRLNSPGQFHLPGTRVEALYAPEMLGEIPNNVFVIAP